MLRRFAPLAALYSVLVALALPVPLAAEQTPTPESDQAAEQSAEPAPVSPPPATSDQPPATVAPAPAPATGDRRPATSKPAAPEPAAAPAPIAGAAGPGSVSIKDFSFAPASITINAGDTVTWTNTGDESHTATGSGFDTGLLSKGQSGSHTFGTAGSFSYICTPHPFMKGTVVVRGASSGGGGGGGSSSGGSQDPGSSSSGSAGAAADTSGSGDTLPNSGADALPLFVLGLGLFLIGLLSRRRLDARS